MMPTHRKDQPHPEKKFYFLLRDYYRIKTPAMFCPLVNVMDKLISWSGMQDISRCICYAGINCGIQEEISITR
jgi:hypothetical protein